MPDTASLRLIGALFQIDDGWRCSKLHLPAVKGSILEVAGTNKKYTTEAGGTLDLPALAISQSFF